MPITKIKIPTVPIVGMTSGYKDANNTPADHYLKSFCITYHFIYGDQYVTCDKILGLN